MDKPIILFDIDHTLIDTNKLRKQISAALISAIGTNKNLFADAENRYIKSLNHPHDFAPSDYIKQLSQRFGAEKEVLNDIFFNRSELYEKSLYSEVKPTLSFLSKKAHLGIFSEGGKKFQTAKIALSGIKVYFDKKLIFIHKRKKSPEALKLLPPKSIIIDDNWEIIETLIEKAPIKAVWINRKDFTKHSQAPTITNLSQVRNLI